MAKQGRPSKRRRAGRAVVRPRAPAAPAVATRRDYLVAALLLIFWIAPISYRNLFRQDLYRWLPPWWNYQYAISCLFEKSMRVWPAFYVQVSSDGNRWTTLPEAPYWPMQPFGHVSRMWFMLYPIKDLPTYKKWAAEAAGGAGQWEAAIKALSGQARELAQWHRRQYERLHPEAPPVRGLRFVHSVHVVGQEIATPAGPWQRPPLHTVPPARKRVIYTEWFP